MLSYQVASPHFLPDGATAFKGTYNLIMRSDVARCLYKFSSTISCVKGKTLKKVTAVKPFCPVGYVKK
ncbi:MAG: hypothetical protein EBV30_08490 [Actinobacteria bacterium]|nr:hypothetical protein [Actinomycetota bacterium]